jgi:hypothetical protein
MPQTSGEAAAAYHAEHAVRAGQPPREEEPRKVLVDTVRVRDGEPLDAGDPTTPPAAFAMRGDPTYVVPARLGPRVVLAAVAGLAVVALLFVAFDRPASHGAPAPAVGAPAAPVVAEPLPPAVQAPEHALQAPVENTPPAPSGPAEDLPAAPPVPPPASSHRHGHGPKGSGGPDLGEFKTTF